MPFIHLNYTILSFRGFEIYPLELSSDDILIQEVLRKVSSERPLSFLGNDLVFWMLKESIPFDQAQSCQWLFDQSADLTNYATRIFYADNLSHVWTERNPSHLHAVLRIGSVIPKASG